MEDGNDLGGRSDLESEELDLGLPPPHPGCLLTYLNA